jgi:regulator of sigma E protease
LEVPLQPGDRILAVDGAAVSSAVQILSQLQTKKLHIIVQRESTPSLSWKDADGYFASSIPVADLIKMTSSIGTKEPIKQLGNLTMLNPVTPKPYSDFPLSEEQKEERAELLAAQKKQIEEIKDPKERAYQLKMLEQAEKRLMLGINLQDLTVSYNPSPLTLFADVFKETYRTLISLVTGYLNPKWLSGPVGIVQVIHYGWTIGIKEALFWMAVISMNLGLLNLLPLPVLDGGHIFFAAIESITKKPIKSKTMEKMIIPFVVLLVALFVYLTYNDLIRLFHRFF